MYLKKGVSCEEGGSNYSIGILALQLYELLSISNRQHLDNIDSNKTNFFVKDKQCVVTEDKSNQNPGDYKIQTDMDSISDLQYSTCSKGLIKSTGPNIQKENLPILKSTSNSIQDLKNKIRDIKKTNVSYTNPSNNTSEIGNQDLINLSQKISKKGRANSYTQFSDKNN